MNQPLAKKGTATMPERSDLTAKRAAVLAPYRWKPGQSGNVNGKAGVLAKRIRQATDQGREMFEFLLSLMRDPNEPSRVRVAACGMLMDRAFGRPRQEIEFPDGASAAQSTQTNIAIAVLQTLPSEVIDRLYSALLIAADPPPSKFPGDCPHSETLAGARSA